MSVRTPREIAREMLRIYDGKPERWTQGTFARSITGRSVRPEGASARSWCLVGVLRRVCDGTIGGDGADEFIDAAHALERRAVAIPKWNDAPERTFDDVVKLLTEVAEGAVP